MKNSEGKIKVSPFKQNVFTEKDNLKVPKKAYFIQEKENLVHVKKNTVKYGKKKKKK